MTATMQIPDVVTITDEKGKLAGKIASQGTVQTKANWPTGLVTLTEEVLEQMIDDATAYAHTHTGQTQAPFQPQDVAELEGAFDQVIDEYARQDLDQIEQYANKPRHQQAEHAVLSDADIQQIENFANQHPDASLAELEKMLTGTEEANHDHLELAKEHTQPKGQSIMLAYAKAKLFEQPSLYLYPSTMAEDHIQVYEEIPHQHNWDEVAELETIIDMLRNLAGVDLAQRLATKKRIENADFHLPLSELTSVAAQMRDNQKRMAQAGAKAQEEYQRRMKRSQQSREVLNGQQTNLKDFGKMMEKVAKETLAQQLKPESATLFTPNPAAMVKDPNKLSRQMLKAGVSPDKLTKGLIPFRNLLDQEFTQTLYAANRLRGFDPITNVHDERTKVAQGFDRPLWERFGDRAERLGERVFG